MLAKQRGLSFVLFLLWAVIAVLVSIGGMKLIPAYMQYEQVKNMFIAIANDPDLKKGSRGDILMAFTKRASVDNITAINAEDIDIIKDNERLILSASYVYKVPLLGNVSLCLDFSPSSAN